MINKWLTLFAWSSRVARAVARPRESRTRLCGGSEDRWPRRSKPGALRNGAPFKDWVLPGAMERVRRKLTGVNDGNRQMVDILTAVLTDGLPAVDAACAEAIAQGVHSADVVLNILARPVRPRQSSRQPR
jgi:hypothetical protein